MFVRTAREVELDQGLRHEHASRSICPSPAGGSSQTTEGEIIGSSPAQKRVKHALSIKHTQKTSLETNRSERPYRYGRTPVHASFDGDSRGCCETLDDSWVVSAGSRLARRCRLMQLDADEFPPNF